MSTEWSPPDEFLVKANAIVARAGVRAIRRERVQRSNEIEAYTAANPGVGGGPIHGIVRKAAREAIQSFGAEIESNPIDLVLAVYKRITPGGAAWIQQRVRDALEAFIAQCTKNHTEQIQDPRGGRTNGPLS